MKKVSLILGTRPELIKLAPIFKGLKARQVDYQMIHTGQHYSKEMWFNFFDELEIPFSGGLMRYDLSTKGELTRNSRLSWLLQRLDTVLRRDMPDLVIVQGDTDSGLAGALAANNLHIPIAHIESGLRSFDKRQPEEDNRILIDHMATYLFPPTPEQWINLKNEGLVPHNRQVHIVGNTISDVVGTIPLSKSRIHAAPFAFVTLHREENVDNRELLRLLLEGLILVGKQLNLKMIFSVHPRTAARITELHLSSRYEKMVCIPPRNYTECLKCQRDAALVMTDSGGLVEESCILGTPTVTLRKTTDRPETIKIGASILASEFNPPRILEAAQAALKLKKGWKHPYGENVTDKILEVLLK